MISERERDIYKIFQFLVALVIMFHSMICYGVMWLLREGLDPAPRSYIRFAVFCMIGLLAEAGTRGEELRATPGRGVGRFLLLVTQRQWLWLFALVAFELIVFRDMKISRLYVITFLITAFFLLFGLNRWGYGSLLRYLSRRNPRWKLRAILVGPEDWMKDVRDSFDTLATSLRRTDEYLVDNRVEFPELFRWVEKQELDLLVLPAELLPDEWVRRLVALGARRGFRCWLPVNLSRRYGSRFRLQRVGELEILTPPAHPLANSANRLLKRIFDIGFALFVICVVLLPVMALVAIIHRIYSPGPLFFRQNRLGENGTVFEVIKFRTMHLDNDDEARQANEHDPRVFKGGHFLRKLSLDEFPQFLNVLRGQMSVVGPRPHLEIHEREFEKFHERYGMRRFVKPGVTGLAQVRGYRGEIIKPSQIRGRARYDLIYVGNWCITLDFRIIIQTAMQVIRPHRNAY